MEKDILVQYHREKEKILEKCDSYEEYDKKIRELCKRLKI